MENQALPRAYNLDTPNMISAYRDFDPSKFNYIYRSGIKWPTLKVGALETDGFTIPYKLRGKPDAPFLAIDLPGGPGSTLGDRWKAIFDIGHYRAVTADWRGVGPSGPLGKLDANTSDKLVEDIEQLRLATAKTPDEKIVLCGGSWGMTMAIAYAAKYPQNVAAIVARLPFLARAKDVDWNYAPDGGLAKKYPDAYNDFVGYVGNTTEPQEIFARYAKALVSPDANERLEAYAAWSDWENARNGETVKIDRAKLAAQDPEEIAQRLARASIMVEYSRNNFFLNDGAGIVPDLDKIPKNVPIVISANTRDPLCAPDTLDVLKDKLPNARFLLKDADWHWVSPIAAKPEIGFDNSFILQAYAYGPQYVALSRRNMLATLEPALPVMDNKRADDLRAAIG